MAIEKTHTKRTKTIKSRRVKEESSLEEMKSPSIVEREEQPVLPQVVEPTPVEPLPETEVHEETVSEILETIQYYRRIIREAETKVSRLFKKLPSSIKKESRKKRSKSSSSRNTEQSYPVTDSFADFLGVSHGTQLSRKEVHKAITTYVKDNNLQCSDDKKCFEADEKLGLVLGEPKHAAHGNNPELRHSYMNIMKLISGFLVK